jgi:hypothetical protein
LDGCSAVQDKNGISLACEHPRGNPLDYNFTVDCGDNMTSGSLWLNITPGPNMLSSAEWFIENISQGKSRYEEKYTFPNNNPSPTNYTVYAKLKKTTSPYDVIATSENYSFSVSYQTFNMIELSMTGDNLWPDCSGYNAYQKRTEAFGDANVIINTTKRITELSNTIGPGGQLLDLSNRTRMF